MKTCQPCGAACADDAPHCSACGEASFVEPPAAPVEPPRDDPAPEGEPAPEEPADATAAAPTASRRRRANPTP